MGAYVNANSSSNIDTVIQIDSKGNLHHQCKSSEKHTKAIHETSSVSYDPLSINDLNVVSNKMWEGRSKWELIGLELKLDPSDLETIKEANNSDPDKCFMDMLKKWLRKGSATWEALIIALEGKKVNHLQLAKSIAAKSIAAKFCTVSTSKSSGVSSMVLRVLEHPPQL